MEGSNHWLRGAISCGGELIQEIACAWSLLEGNDARHLQVDTSWRGADTQHCQAAAAAVLPPLALYIFGELLQMFCLDVSQFPEYVNH